MVEGENRNVDEVGHGRAMVAVDALHDELEARRMENLARQKMDPLGDVWGLHEQTRCRGDYVQTWRSVLLVEPQVAPHARMSLYWPDR